MTKILPALTLAVILSISAVTQAVQYDDFEIQQQLNQKQLSQLSTDYIHDYYRSSTPRKVIDELLAGDLSPLQREFILFNLLNEISIHPPQAFHQNFIDRMKTYPIQATRSADEGHLPVAIFNLNSKAYGIENIWTAYLTEQRFNQLFAKTTEHAVAAIQVVLTEPSAKQRPQWLGIKNSIAALPDESVHQLSQYLLNSVQPNTGLDALISHVGLFTGQTELIEKALTSTSSQVRELTLRQLSTHLPAETTQSMLLAKAQSGPDRKFSTSLLSQFSADETVERFLLEQLSNKTTASNAAFALSQSDNLRLAHLLKKRYLQSQDSTEKEHLLLTLKLNPSNTSQLVLDDLLQHIEQDSNAGKWLKSFQHKPSGEQP